MDRTSAPVMVTLVAVIAAFLPGCAGRAIAPVTSAQWQAPVSVARVTPERLAFRNGIPLVVPESVERRVEQRRAQRAARPAWTSRANPALPPPPPSRVFVCGPGDSDGDTEIDCGRLKFPPQFVDVLTCPAPHALINKAQGTVVSTHPDLWFIANTGGSNIFICKNPGGVPTPYTVPSLNDAGQYPVDVDASYKASQLLVAVSNASTTTLGSGSAGVYNALHGPTPLVLPAGSDSVRGIGIALDSKRDCYWSYLDNGPKTPGGFIVKFPGCSPGVPVNIVLLGANIPGGIAFDVGDNMYYADQTAKAVIRCTAASGYAACAVYQGGFSDPLFINWDSNWHHLWVADYGAATLDWTVGAGITSYPLPDTDDPIEGVAPYPGSLW